MNMIAEFMNRIKRNRQIRRLDALIAERRNVYPIHLREVRAIGPYASAEWARRSIEQALGGR